MTNDILTGEQVRVILHISKRKVAWMFQNGYIPCIDSGKKTRRYLVRRADLEQFITDLREHPELFHTPIGIFTAAHPNTTDHLPKELPPEFRPWLEARFWRYHLALTLDDVSFITGYNIKTIHRWVNNGILRSTQVQGDIIVPREWLVDFYCTQGYHIPVMCKKHKKMLKKFFKK